MRKIDRTGEIKTNNQGCLMKIIKYNNYDNIDIQFENGYILKNKSYKEFKNGKIKNLYYPEVFNIGYIGEGKHKAYINGNHTKKYICWHGMIQRCCNKEYKEKHLTYKDCIVCEEWLNFQNFAEWYDNNYYEIDGERMCLDKDILVKGNKIYSPETCVFAPNRINVLFTKRKSKRGENPIGVSYSKTNKKFVSYCNIGMGSIEHLGYFNTPEEAFECYKKFKESYIKQVADEYKDKIPKKLYEAMYNYNVEITD